MARHTFKTGARVVLARNVDRFPDFIAKAGATGTVCAVDADGRLAVKMDEPIAGCEEWNNEIHWYDDYLGEDLEGDLVAG